MPTSTLQGADTSHLVIGLDEVAKVLRRTPDNIKRNWLKLHRELGMPRKHAAGWIWPRASFNVWLTSPASVEAVPGNDNTGDTPPDLHSQRVADQKAALHAQLGVTS